ncbi:MAG: 3'-5' exonuclease, partial [Saprospiraceae bacterium]
MLQQIDIANVLFLDIETVSGHADFSELPEDLQALWAHKASNLLKGSDAPPTDEAIAESYRDRAAIYAEFGKIICISVGALHRDKDGRLRVRLKSFAGADEAALLRDFNQLLGQYYNDPFKFFLCGHNIKEFDIPYICRRMVVHS